MLTVGSFGLAGTGANGPVEPARVVDCYYYVVLYFVASTEWLLIIGPAYHIEKSVFELFRSIKFDGV